MYRNQRSKFEDCCQQANRRPKPSQNNNFVNETRFESDVLQLTLAKLVDFPTPFTPQKVMTYGRFCARASTTSRKISMRRFGVKIETKVSRMACRMLLVKLSNEPNVFPSNFDETDSQIFCATSAATFFAIKCSRIASIPVCKSSVVNVFEAKTLTFFSFDQKLSTNPDATFDDLQ